MRFIDSSQNINNSKILLLIPYLFDCHPVHQMTARLWLSLLTDFARTEPDILEHLECWMYPSGESFKGFPVNRYFFYDDFSKKAEGWEVFRSQVGRNPAYKKASLAIDKLNAAEGVKLFGSQKSSLAEKFIALDLSGNNPTPLPSQNLINKIGKLLLPSNPKIKIIDLGFNGDGGRINFLSELRGDLLVNYGVSTEISTIILAESETSQNIVLMGGDFKHSLASVNFALSEMYGTGMRGSIIVPVEYVDFGQGAVGINSANHRHSLIKQYFLQYITAMSPANVQVFIDDDPVHGIPGHTAQICVHFVS